MDKVKTKFVSLSFAHRVAFICNIFFVLCMIIRYTNADKIIPQPLIELSAILGWIFSPAINLICLFVSFVLVLKEGKGINAPLWLVVANLFFFVFEIFYFFIS
jgi:hypothetical protein